jgi:hypothetical protein
VRAGVRAPWWYVGGRAESGHHEGTRHSLTHLHSAAAAVTCTWVLSSDRSRTRASATSVPSTSPLQHIRCNGKTSGQETHQVQWTHHMVQCAAETRSSHCRAILQSLPVQLSTMHQLRPAVPAEQAPQCIQILSPCPSPSLLTMGRPPPNDYVFWDI